MSTCWWLATSRTSLGRCVTHCVVINLYLASPSDTKTNVFIPMDITRYTLATLHISFCGKSLYLYYISIAAKQIADRRQRVNWLIHSVYRREMHILIVAADCSHCRRRRELAPLVLAMIVNIVLAYEETPNEKDSTYFTTIKYVIYICNICYFRRKRERVCKALGWRFTGFCSIHAMAITSPHFSRLGMAG